MQIPHGRRWTSALIAVAAIALAVTASGTSGDLSGLVAPGATLDQANNVRSPACRYTGWVPDYATSWAAQTFTAGITGSLTDVVATLRIKAPQQITVAITPVDAEGQPIVATTLASTSLSEAANTTYTDVAVSFSAPARVEAGTQYAIVLSSPVEYADAGIWFAWKGDVGSSVRDPAGTQCADGAYARGRAWTMGLGPLGADADFFFQTYVLPARHLTVVRSGTGSGLVQDATRAVDCGTTCSAEFPQGQTVTLTAKPDRGSTFSGWSGGCVGSSANCSLTLNADTTVTAEFTRTLVTLTVRKVGSGTVSSAPPGIACGKRCSNKFVPGPVKLTARPSAAWRFAHWQGACRDTRAVCRLTLRRATTVTAIFVKRRRQGK